MAQRLQDHIADQIKRNGQRVTYRFSPGYCDWPVTEQKKLFRFLEAERIGVRLLDSCLMQPRKTISGIFGLEEAAQEKMPPPYNPCRDCGRTQCRERRK
jgi:cobalamin-dependent methionine synthase I